LAENLAGDFVAGMAMTHKARNVMSWTRTEQPARSIGLHCVEQVDGKLSHESKCVAAKKPMAGDSDSLAFP
jgi:hypothetical protein